MALDGYKPPRDKLSPEEELNEKNVKLANSREFRSLFVDKLGLNVNQPGDKVPDSGNGVPRVFLFKDGKVTSLEENGIKTGSKEFWETAIKGQLFAYPAGEKHPVQITASKNPGMPLKVFVTDPLDPEKQKPNVSTRIRPEVVDKPSFFQRLFKFGKNRQACERYDRYVREDKAWVEEQKRSVQSYRETAKALNSAFGSKRIADFNTIEKEEKQAILESQKESRALTEAEAWLKTTRRGLSSADQGVQNAMSMYQPKPEFNPKWTSAKLGQVYTEEQFRKLKPLTVDVNAIPVGGQGVSDKEFAALALFAAHDPKIAFEAQKVVSDPNALSNSFQKAGFTKPEAEEIIVGSISEIYSRSMMMCPSRPGSGSYFDCAVQPGRENAQAALEAYQRGNKEQLATILSYAVGVAGSEAKNGTKMEGDFFAKNQFALSAVELMERDPELKELAKQKFEAREESFHQNHPDLPRKPAFDEQVKTIRQIRKVELLRNDAEASKAALLDARIKGTELTAEEKKNHAKTILKAQFVKQQYRNSFYQGETSEQYGKMNTLAMQLPKSEQGIGSAGGSSLPTSPEAVFVPGMECRFRPKPEILNVLDSNKAMQQLDQKLDLLIQKEGLANATTRQLSDKLTPQAVKGTDLYNLAEKLLTVDQPAPQKAPEQAKQQEVEKAPEQNDQIL